MTNRQIWLRSTPNSVPAEEHFAIRETEVPTPAEGQFLIRNAFLSVDPAMRGWLLDEGNYLPRVSPGDTMRAFAVGEIIQSRNPDFTQGEYIVGLFGWQEYAVASPEQVLLRVTERDLPLSTALGVLGLNGIAAYFGLLEICAPRAGETIVISTAAGAVGSCAGQIAKALGCRTVAITGGEDKRRRCVDDFGFEVAIDYKAEHNLEHALAQACPNGIDCYFDNTAGPISDAVLANLALGGRVAICGTAALAAWSPWPQGPRVERHLLTKRASMKGFIALDYKDRFPEAITHVAEFVRSGKIRYFEDILDGLEAAPSSIERLYSGRNKGKLVIRL
ncbi:NADP-dependent oxidoreductase [Croceicoccus pelagius]|uniref:NADP-dependent oxidoreductase n=1 Tax=Croceicoccus pelagius TaxID=1703341 RepID=A0A916YNY1_9SPHN|nr:NADP-dependent oxidoreductase [Croceicoccus pelagius]GGD54428.1 NADP-dependent oxidoreductase [Croceicoccus pelagius]